MYSKIYFILFKTIKKGIITMATKAKEEFITIKHKAKVLDTNGEPITILNEKGRKVFQWEEKEITYRVDAGFIPKRIDEICEDFIQNYCIANDKEDWLDSQYSEQEDKTITNKKTGKITKKKQPKSFVSIRSAFAKEFFPNIIIGKQEKDKKRVSAWEAKKKAKAQA